MARSAVSTFNMRVGFHATTVRPEHAVEFVWDIG
jgi:hypothetical protein